MELHVKLKHLRKQRGLTLTDVSERVGLSISTLSDLENGRIYPSLKTLLKLAACYQISMVNLFEDVHFPEWGGGTSLPPALKALQSEMDIPPDIVELMLKVDLIARRKAKSREDWLQIYYVLRALIT